MQGKMSSVLLFASVFLSVAARAASGERADGASVDWRIVAADQSVPALVMFSGAPGASTNVLWRWDPRADPSLSEKRAASFGAIDECKVIDGGRTILANASCGGVAAVDVASARAKWCAYLPDFCAGPHSVDLLPDGRIAVANSTGVDALQIIDLAGHPFEPEKQRVVKALPVAGAHGVVWDAARQSLFVLGYTNLYELAYLPEEIAVSVRKVWDYSVVCGDAYGHDLVPDGRGGYHFTNHTAVWRIDPTDGSFSKVLDVANVKSFSRDAKKGDLLSTPRERWWTDRLSVRDGEGRTRTVGPFAGARFYKARWMFQDCPREK